MLFYGATLVASMASGNPREAFRRFTTTVGLITTHGSRGPNVMAAEWTFNISYRPFLISVHVGPEQATHEAIVESGEFGVNLVAEDQVLAMGFAGHFSKYDTDKLSSEVFETYPAKKIKAPMIKGCLLNAECRLVQRVPMGDHVAFVGEVIEFSVDGEKSPVVLHQGAHRLGARLRRGSRLVVAATPMEARPGASIVAAGEFTSPKRAAKPVRVTIPGQGNTSLVEATTKTDEGGYFSVELVLPGDLEPGAYAVVARHRVAEGRARLRVVPRAAA